MTKINTVVYGNVPKEFIDFVVSTLSHFYSKVQSDLPIVDLYIYSTVNEKRRVLEEEALKRGVYVVGDFITSHDAWRGVPRIHVCYETLENLSNDLKRTLILHEGAHSVLHGSIASYIASPSAKIISRLGLQKALTATYMVSTAIKDYEVTVFLIEKNYKDYAIKYADYVINEFEVTDKDFYGKLQLIKALACVAALVSKLGDIGSKYVKYFTRFLPKKKLVFLIKIFNEVIKYGKGLELSDKINIFLSKLIEENFV